MRSSNSKNVQCKFLKRSNLVGRKSIVSDLRVLTNIDTLNAMIRYNFELFKIQDGGDIQTAVSG